jgi:hypothetical protein
MGIGRETNKKTLADKAVRSGRDEYEQDLAEERKDHARSMLEDLYGSVEDVQDAQDAEEQDLSEEEEYFDALYDFNGRPVPRKLSEPMSLGELLKTRKGG